MTTIDNQQSTNESEFFYPREFIEELEDKVLTSGRAAELIYGGAVLANDKGREFSSHVCPSCNEPKFSISKTQATASCWRSSCELSTRLNWWHYLERVKFEPFSAAMLRVSQAMGLEPPKKQLTEKQKAEYKKTLERREILTAADEHFRAALFTAAGAATLAYLKNERGYSEESIKEMGLGSFVGIKQLAAGLEAAGYSQAMAIAERLVSSKQVRSSHPVTLAMRTRSGSILGFTNRYTIEPFDNAPKYLYSLEIEKKLTLNGYEYARGRDEIAICESPIGAAYIRAQGINLPFVAIGGSSLSKEQIETLRESKTGKKRLILALDGNLDDNKSTASLIEQLAADGWQRSSMFVINYSPLKDGNGERVKPSPDDTLTHGGPAALIEAIDGSTISHKWLAWYVVSQHDVFNSESGDIERERCLATAADDYLKIDDSIERREYLNELGDNLGLEADELRERFKDALTEHQHQEQRITAKIEAEKLSKLAADGNLREFERKLADSQDVMRRERGIEPPSSYTLSQLEQDALNRPPTMKIGINILDEEIGIPIGAMTTIAARSGHGKTTFLLNLLNNWASMQELEDKRLYFFTYEEPRLNIAVKLIAMRAGLVLDSKKNFDAYLGYIKRRANGNATHETKREIDEAIQWYERVTSSGRLNIIDEHYNGDDLAALISAYAERGDLGAVIVDYIQVIPMSGGYNTRQLELKALTEILRAVIVRHNIPFITAAQLNRNENQAKYITEAHIREAADLYNESTLVLGLFNLTAEAAAKKDGSDASEPDDYQRVRIDITKNRYGRSGLSRNIRIKNGSGYMPNLGNLNNAADVSAALAVQNADLFEGQ